MARRASFEPKREGARRRARGAGAQDAERIPRAAIQAAIAKSTLSESNGAVFSASRDNNAQFLVNRRTAARALVSACAVPMQPGNVLRAAACVGHEVAPTSGAPLVYIVIKVRSAAYFSRESR